MKLILNLMISNYLIFQITIPSWPWYNKNGLNWLPHEEKNMFKTE
jgi:hypothetical protein